MSTTPRRKGAKVASLERLIRAELLAVEVARDLTTYRTEQRELGKDILSRLTQLETSMHKNQGFWGAVLLIGGAVWAATTFLWDHIVAAFQR